MEPLVAAEDILTRYFDGKVQLEVDAHLPSSDRTHVLRCRVSRGTSAAPASVILKQSVLAYGSTFDGAVDGNVWDEWAGLRFIGKVAPDVAIPYCYGGDTTLGLIILEDLGNQTTLKDLLIGVDAEAAKQGLFDYSSMLGKLHARTYQQERTFNEMRSTIGPYEQQHGFYQHQFRQLGQRFQAMTQALQISPRQGALRDLEVVRASLQHPGPFSVYCHGDLTPSNIFVDRTTATLIDFEYGCCGHALLDGVNARMLFPSGGPFYDLPRSIIQQMEAVYRTTLATGCPAAHDEHLWQQAMVVACAYWTITLSVWLPFATLLERDQKWGNATMRQRAIVRSERFAEITELTGYGEALGATFHMLAARMRALWPEATDVLSMYPAFQSSVD